MATVQSARKAVLNRVAIVAVLVATRKLAVSASVRVSG